MTSLSPKAGAHPKIGKTKAKSAGSISNEQASNH